MTPTLGESPCGVTTGGVAFSASECHLSSDVHAAPPFLGSCFVLPPLPRQPRDAVQVDSGSTCKPVTPLTFSEHCLALHGLTACPATSPAYSILILKVTVPGRSKPVYVSIGLAGNGMVARTILYSLRAAS